MERFLCVCGVALCIAPALAGELPDPTRTPGRTNPAVKQSTINNTICVSGWTATIRPSVSYTNKLKKQQLDEYGYSDKVLAHYEEDHRVPLEVGGHPRDPKNLWPEPRDGDWGARKKDQLENYIKRQVCAGKITLKQGQAVFLGDWKANYHKWLRG
jgi:hypothetical protein